MTRSVTIPLDIIYQIIEEVGDDERTLKRCALVSSSFLIPSRKQLFSEICLDVDRRCQRLHECLIRNPVIRSFVRGIVISPVVVENSVQPLNSTSLLATLRLPFCRLESLSIHSSSPLDWSSFNSELEDAISNIIRSSTLKTLDLYNVVNVPITLFRGIAHLSELKLDCISPFDFDGVQSGAMTPAASKAAATTASQTIIDQCRWSFYELIHEGPTEPVFLPFMCHLRSVEVYAHCDSAEMLDLNILSFLMRSLFISLTIPPTLEHLKFKIQFVEVVNSFEYYELLKDLREADVWRHLDSIITHPAGSRLKRVDINIAYALSYGYEGVEPDSDDVSGSVLHALPLLREKGILFVEAAKVPITHLIRAATSREDRDLMDLEAKKLHMALQRHNIGRQEEELNHMIESAKRVKLEGLSKTENPVVEGEKMVIDLT